MNIEKIKQKDIILVSLSPTVGHEQCGTRPAVVVSAEAYHVSGMCLMCPLTQKLKKFFGDVILKPNQENKLDKESEILVGQIRAVDQKRIIKNIGKISDNELERCLIGLNALCGK